MLKYYIIFKLKLQEILGGYLIIKAKKVKNISKTLARGRFKTYRKPLIIKYGVKFVAIFFRVV